MLCLAFAREAGAFVVPFDGTLTVASLANQTSVRAADIDRDGDLDLVSITESAGGAVSWIENTNGSGTSWTPHTIAAKVSTGSTVSPVDLDGDGDIDVLATLPSDNATVWYENTSGNGSTWAAAETVNDTASGHVSSAAGDFDRDGDLDVVIGSSGTIRWFVNFNGDASSWSAANGVGTLAGGSAVHVEVADVDRDGRLDVAAAWDGTSKGVAWYRTPAASRSALSTRSAWTGRSGSRPRASIPTPTSTWSWSPSAARCSGSRTRTGWAPR